MAKDTKAADASAGYSAAGLQAFKSTVDKSLQMLNDLNAQSKNNFEAMVASAAAANQGVEALRAQIMEFGKKSVDDNIAAAQALASARTVQDVVELQTNWAKSAMTTYIAEVTKASETLSASLKQTFGPINNQFTSAVEKLQRGK